MTYPTTRRVDHVDTYHGVAVPDPYRWLEDDTSPETAVSVWSTATTPAAEPCRVSARPVEPEIAKVAAPARTSSYPSPLMSPAPETDQP